MPKKTNKNLQKYEELKEELKQQLITKANYNKVTNELLEKYIEFKDQDVLFLYSTLVLNSSSVLK